ncbi:hypothetical protein G9U51_08445 [Calidifontibacter sp. DB0510]|uniref:Uncharacterized protein n=1 Tax=Metallococcus carri TaxID=1656884 RepID=A0A967B1S1_9MICO|nr:hypothetical protein [Metallococcus carri]NHN55805.1 hypothetical protein [Metallococcus carri]NOP38507.1 hypothetical protein [Calidifontibacter sp. DB2511S]
MTTHPLSPLSPFGDVFTLEATADYLTQLYALEYAARSRITRIHRACRTVPPQDVAAALRASERLAVEREAFRARFFPRATRVVVGGDRVLVDGRLVFRDTGDRVVMSGSPAAAPANVIPFPTRT